MQNAPATKISFLGIVCICLFLLSSHAIAVTQKTTNWLNESINISFQNEPLSKVLKQISQQTGVSIAYDRELANEKVTGNYQNVKIPDAITRLFKSKNKSIQVNNAKKIIIVKTFGAKSFIWAESLQGQNHSMTLAELQKMHTQQYKEYKERIANDNEILDEGMTRGELRKMHKKQYTEYKASLQDGSIVEEGGVTRAELRTMQEKQYRAYQADLKNNNAILEGGMSRKELQKMHKKQYTEYQEMLEDDTNVVEEGMTRGELRAMHAKQFKEYKAYLKNSSKVAE